MTAFTNRNAYMRRLMERRRIEQRLQGINQLNIELDPTARQLLDEAQKRTGFSKKALVNQALIAYLTPQK